MDNVNKNIKLLTWFNFFTDLRFFAPVLVIYYEKVAGSFGLGMSIFSVIFVTAAILEIPTGIFSDKIGRKMTMTLGALSYVIGLTFLALANSYLLLVIGGFFEGLARSLYSGNNNALLHDTLKEAGKENDYHHYLGRTSSMFQISSGVAAILGGLIASFSFSLVIWISALAQAICLVISLFIYEPKLFSKDETGNIYAHLRESVKIFLENKKLRLLGIASMIDFGVGNSGFEFQAAWYATIWPTWALGLARTISNATAAFGYYFAGKIINKLTAIKTLLAETIVVPLGKIISVLVPNPITPAIMASFSLFYGPSSVAGETLRQKEFTDQQRATMGSLISLGGSLTNAVAAVLIGLVADKFGIIQAIICVQLFLLVTQNILYLKIYKSQ